MTDPISRRTDSDDLIRRMQEDPSTNNIVNSARTQAGMKTSVSIKGDDTSYAELKEDYANENIREWKSDSPREMAATLLEVGCEGSAIGLIGPALTIAALVKGVAKDDVHAEELGKAQETDQMHLAVLSALDMPAKFKSEESQKYAGGAPGFQSGFMKVAGALDQRPDLKAVLQLHADRGSNAAFDLIKTGALKSQSDIGEALTKYPDVKAKFDADPAFQAGFKLAAWAHDQGKATFTKVAMPILSRDARYENAGIHVRG